MTELIGRSSRQGAMKISARLAVLLGALLLTACGGGGGATPPASDAPGSPTPAPHGDGTLTVEPGTAGGPGISIDEALASAGSEPLLVNGALFVDPEGTMLLCSAIAESFPPQCGGTRLQVTGIDISSIPGVQKANGVQWVERAQLLGTVAPAS
jgi:hypothetical protein